MMTLWLASQSPRRQEMLAWLGVRYEIVVADIDETPDPRESPAETATRLACRKGQAAARMLAPDAEDAWVLTADTVVDFHGESLGKPADPAEAFAMLCRLRDRRHQVHTGVALTRVPGGTQSARRVTTHVGMRAYNEEELARYVASGDPMDKAGAYAIQHEGFHPVCCVQRCYANVVGLPLCAVVKLFNDQGFGIQVDVRAICYRHFGYRCPKTDPGVSV